MDKLKRLQALTGDEDVCGRESSSQPFMFPTPKPQSLHEGMDSDDDEVITSRVRRTLAKHKEHLEPSSIQSEINTVPRDCPEYHLQIGELPTDGESFCTFQTVKRYPYAYIGTANRQRVAEGFFAQEKLLNQPWDFFYLYRASLDPNQQPILLLPTRQVAYFLSIINQSLGTRLTIPTGGAKSAFQVTFENDGTPQPRYLGRSTDKETADELRNNIPSSYYRPDGEPSSAAEPSDRALAAFQAKVNLMVQAQKGKKLASKEKQKKERIEKQRSWNHGIKRVQRYLGLREVQKGDLETIRASSEKWDVSDAAVEAATAKLPPSTAFNPGHLARFEQEGSVIFICVDVEAYERNTKLITEIGIATLDTEDIASIVPGEGGANWMGVIRARHFRINEHKHLNNVEFVAGCADRFEFGASEFINLKDAPHIIASCFMHPFSKCDGTTSGDGEQPKRNVVLVGHDIGADIKFLQTIGYDVHNLSNLLETADTAFMWRYLKSESNPRNLGSILAELGITGWNLHNAGNDAVYTLHAMIAIAIKHIVEENKAKDIRDQEKKTRNSEALKEDTKDFMEREKVQSSEDSDGGAPVAPVPSSAPKGKRGAGFKSRERNDGGRSIYSEAWRPEACQIGEQRRLWEDNSRAPPSARPSQSSLSGKGAPFTSNLENLEDYLNKTTLSGNKSNKSGGYRGGKSKHADTNKDTSSWLNE